MTDRQDIIAAHVRHLAKSLLLQCEQSGGWPARLIFPAPRDDAEREALRRLARNVENATGLALNYTTEPGAA